MLSPFRRRALLVILALLALSGILAVVVFNLVGSRFASLSADYIRRWFNSTAERPALTNARVACPGAPFILPSAGLVGLLWDDPTRPYNLLNPHSGIDIFGAGQPGEDAVYAAYDGYLTRLPDWVSTVIIRHDDPLQPGRTIWTYYTHMASLDGESFISPDFPPDTREQFVAQGTLLGYQGEYSPNQRVGLHLHFSMVLGDPDGGFLNEARIANTLDPSPYFRMSMNSDASPARPLRCWGF
jgi:hypothetical protein